MSASQARMFPLRSLSGAIVHRAPSAVDHPLDYALDEQRSDEDTTMQRHQEPTR